MKTCRQCKETLGASSFRADKRRPDGLYDSCKACLKVAAPKTDLEQLHMRSVAAISHYWNVTPEEAETLISRFRERKSIKHKERLDRIQQTIQQRDVKQKEKIKRVQQKAIDSNMAASCSVCGEFAIYLNKNDEVVCVIHFTADDFS